MGRGGEPRYFSLLSAPGGILGRDRAYSLTLFPALDRHPMIAPSSLVDPAPELKGLHSPFSFLQNRGVAAAAALWILGGFSGSSIICVTHYSALNIQLNISFPVWNLHDDVLLLFIDVCVLFWTRVTILMIVIFLKYFHLTHLFKKCYCLILFHKN